MAPITSKYLSLRTIVNDWASSSGEPALLIIRRIGEWALMDGFASDAFIQENGKVISRIDIYSSCVAVAESQLHSNGPSTAAVAIGALVHTSSIVEFCRLNDVGLPKSMARSLSLFRSIFESDATHVAPPACPGAFDRAKHLDAQSWATGALDVLMTMLDGVKSGLTGTAAAPGMTEVGELAIRRWSIYADMAQSSINQSDLPELQVKLNALLAGWEEVLRQAKPDCPKERHDEGMPVEIRKDVALGRPKGSPYSKQDGIMVEEIRAEVIKSGLSPSAVADTLAHRMEGTNSEPSSRAKRVLKVYQKKYSKIF